MMRKAGAKSLGDSEANRRGDTMSETLQIKRPCERRWSDLTGNGGTRRFCADCNKFVYNLDAMSRAEIDTLRRAGGFCATYVADEGGSFVMPGPARATSAPAALAAVVLVSVLSGCSGGEPPGSATVGRQNPTVSAPTPSECEKKVPTDAFAHMTPEEEEKARERLRSLT